uniref:Antimicrobial peptide microplusin n=1 Tax=Amblyomma aureolatum TaxID=187763 RepID=A0A1E1X1X3_9ACAR
MNAVFASCLFVATLVAAASAHHLELCKKTDQVLATELECIKQHIPATTNAAFDDAVQKLKCSDRSCAIRKMCEGNDLEGAMAKFFTTEQIKHIHDASTTCAPDAHHGHDHSHDHGHH